MNQRILRWQEPDRDGEYCIVLDRGGLTGYRIEGYRLGNAGKSQVPEFSFPYTLEEVKSDFSRQEKPWREEAQQS